MHSTARGGIRLAGRRLLAAQLRKGGLSCSRNRRRLVAARGKGVGARSKPAQKSGAVLSYPMAGVPECGTLGV